MPSRSAPARRQFWKQETGGGAGLQCRASTAKHPGEVAVSLTVEGDSDAGPVGGDSYHGLLIEPANPVCAGRFAGGCESCADYPACKASRQAAPVAAASPPSYSRSASRCQSP